MRVATLTRGSCVLLSLLSAAAVGSTQVLAPSGLAVGGAWFGTLDGDEALEGRLEYRASVARDCRVFVGAMLTSDGASYLGAGFGWRLPLGRRLLVTPTIGPGYYEKGGGTDLGFPLEFRSQLELAYRFDAGATVALAFSHLSNASLGRRNPGQESLALYFELPLRRR